jgi:hypothetical protein
MNRRQMLAATASMAAAAILPATGSRAQGSDAMYGDLLKTYTSLDPSGLVRVDYARWSQGAADRGRLDGYIADLAGRRPSQMTRAEAFAYWANLYNAVTLKVIVDRYPVASIRDIRSEGVWLDPKAFLGPWRTKRVTVEGKPLSLDDIEHDIMRPTLKDPRVHYSVNCASVGCPNLMMRPWAAATLEADLDQAARAFINSRRGVDIVDKGLKVSSIYKWFIEDFGGNDAGILAHLRKYAQGNLAAAMTEANIRITGDAYDWTLNGAVRTG